VKSYDELREIGENTNNPLLMWQVFISQLNALFWMREYLAVVSLAQKYPPPKHKRALAIMRSFYEGIASLSLARDTRQEKYRHVGEEAVKTVAKFELKSEWNFENKSKLLQAELHYLNGNIGCAGEAYVASIKSAQIHKFLHEEALAYELYGIFCVENKMIDEGINQLSMALDKYKLWGALKKCDDLQIFIDIVSST